MTSTYQHLEFRKTPNRRRRALGTAVVVTLVAIAATVLAVMGANKGDAVAASSSQVPGIGVDRLGNSYATASGYDRYSYLEVGPGDAAAAGALNTTSLVYAAGTTVRPDWTAGVPYSQALANGWLLKSSSGSYIQDTVYHTYIGDFGNPAYQQAFVNWESSFLASTGADGIEIDSTLCDAASLTGGVYPAKYPTQKAWEDAQVSFISYVGDALRAKGYYVRANTVCYIPGNGGSDDASLTAAFWSRLAPHLSGLKSEYWVQTSNDVTRLRSEGNGDWTRHWSGWMKLIDAAQNGGADFFAEMYGTNSDPRIMRYGRASFLLGWDGSGGAFEWAPSDASDPWSPEWTMDIGRPSGLRYNVGVGWRRDFSGGTVILNPDPSASQSFQLGGTFYKPDGSALTSVTLGPTEALILRGSSTTPPPASPVAPVNSAAPAISGTAMMGRTLTASTGTWSGSPTYAYQWRRCNASLTTCTSISGASSTSYVLGGADVGSVMRAVVTATNSGGSATAMSAPSGTVADVPSAAAPVNSAAPAVSGTAVVGQTLTASAGTWSGSPTYAYQWRRCNTALTSCNPISGASSTSYLLAAADVGSVVRVAVTGTNSGGSTTAVSAPSATIADSPPPPAAAPVNTAAPTISGTATSGQTLTASTGAWSGSPTYTYQWQRCSVDPLSCNPIGGASSTAYLLTPSDVGSVVRVMVTATNGSGSSNAASGTSATVTAPATTPPAAPPAAPSNTAAPTISGAATVGQTLTSSPGTWSGSPAYAYQWRRCNTSLTSCNPISGAGSTSYLLGADDIGSVVRVVVTATNAGGSTAAASAPSATVTAPPPPPQAPVAPAPTALPVISGLPQPGQTLRTTTGTFTQTPTSYKYAWYRCNTSGKQCRRSPTSTSSPTYAVTSADIGSTIVAQVAPDGKWNRSLSSSPTAVVSGPLQLSTEASTPAPSPTPSVPTISGTAKVGATLTTSNGTSWGTTPSSFLYAWFRCSASITACNRSPTSTLSPTYAVTSGDVGFRIISQVAPDGDWSRSQNSSPTAVVVP